MAEQNQNNLRSREQSSHALLVNALSLPNQLRPCSHQLSSARTIILQQEPLSVGEEMKAASDVAHFDPATIDIF